MTLPANSDKVFTSGMIEKEKMRGIKGKGIDEWI
jgi:hypothetical protein